MLRRSFLPLLVPLAPAATLAACYVAAGAPNFPAGGVPGEAREPARYAGSRACRDCHPKEFATWEASLHPKQERPATDATVVGDFGDRALEVGEGRARMFRRDGAFFVRTRGPDRVEADFRVLRTIGHYMKQRYVTEFGDGNQYVLPIQWNVRERRWDDYGASSLGNAPGAPEFWAHPSRAWERNCAGCHTTGLALRADEEGRSFEERFAELGIGCEACHGSLADHAAEPENPSKFVRLGSLPPSRQVDVCGQCHSRGTSGPEHGAPVAGVRFPVGFRPGDALATRLEFAEPVFGEKTRWFWPDGSALDHHGQYQDTLRDPHFLKAGMTCTSCHDPHAGGDYRALRAEAADNTLCLECHTARREDLAEHTRHRPGSDGSVCVNCHMPRLVKNANPLELRSHTFWRPDPARSAAHGMPDACTLCHSDRPQSWAAEIVNGWKRRAPGAGPGVLYPGSKPSR